jgi:hypothetical protein
MPPPKITTPVTWLAAPEWLTPQQAADLTGHPLEHIRQIIEHGAVELKDSDQTLIHRDSLHDYQLDLIEVLHWND